MKICCVIPTYNEEAFIGKTLASIASQTHLPKQVVVVNDNSTDDTQQIIDEYVVKHPWISSIYNSSENKHLPGSKVIRAFEKGFETLNNRSEERRVGKEYRTR